MNCHQIHNDGDLLVSRTKYSEYALNLGWKVEIIK